MTPSGPESTDRQTLPALLGTLESLGLDQVGDAAAGVAEQYARAMDQAKQAERWADKVLAKIDRDTDLGDEVAALRTKLAARMALSDLGPKLVALLVELGATPKARAALAKGQPAKPTGGAHLASVRSGVAQGA